MNNGDRYGVYFLLSMAVPVLVCRFHAGLLVFIARAYLLVSDLFCIIK